MNNYFNYYKSEVLVGLISVLAIVIFLAKEQWGISITIAGTITTLLVFTSKHLWKHPLFKWMFWVDNFSGRYEGIVKYQYVDGNGNCNTGEMKQVKIINQTGSRITVSTFTVTPDGTKSSLSVNKGMYVEKTEDEQHYRLIYNYHNEGSTEQGFPPHYGTEVIKFIKNGEDKSLSGNYYTGRHPFQTKGELIDFKHINNNLKHEF
ncbi:MAG: hypothetical protein N4A71_14925 [Carboxylicivirga sp.]|jgi:hypothetical protein|nr:hypothetical protein [Carboxylicivirga sp.]